MNLLVYSAYYEPEVAASLYLSTNLYEDFAASGINVRLYVPIPTRGVSDDVRKEYKVKKEIKTYGRGKLEIIRLNIPKELSNPILRALRYFFMHLAYICAASKFDADAIFVQSTPPTQGLMATFIKKRKKIPLIYNLQDVFPDSMVGAGMAKRKSILYKIGRKIEDYTYRKSDKIITITNDIKNNIIGKGVPAEKITVVPNWIDTSIVFPIEKEENYLFDKYNISRNDFIVVYAGNLGYAQNIEVIIKAAKKLKTYKDIRFVLFGQGAQEGHYRSMAKGMDNVVFLPLQPYSEVSYVYSLGDVSIVPCKKGFGTGAMPSKTWSIMATGTPVLASFDSNTQMQQILEEAQAGFLSEADDYEGLKNNVLKFYKDNQLKEKCGKSALNYVKKHLDRNLCTKQYINAVMETIECRK